jgi:preprotein translocase subunit SecA
MVPRTPGGVMVKSEFRGSRRGKVGWLLVAAVVLPVTGVVLQLLKLPIPTGWTWGIAFVAALAAASPTIIDLWNKWRTPGHELATVARTHLLGLTERGGLQRVRDVTDLLGTLDFQPSKIAQEAAGADRPPPYVRRTRDQCLDQVLGKSSFVLVIGPSKAGKSRSAAEAMRRNFGNRRLVIPAKQESLGVLLEQEFNFSDSVVWLDNLEDRLNPEAAEALGKLLGEIKRNAKQATILATMRSRPLEDHMRSGGGGSLEWRVLQRAVQVDFDRMLNADEREAAHRAFHDARLDEALQRYGLAEYLAAGPEAVTLLRTGATTSPAGRAAVLAAVDWYRVGLARPVPKPTLERLYPAYLGDDDRVGPEAANRSEAFENGLKWAKAQIEETSALLTEEAGGLVPFAYLLDYVEDESQGPIPAGTWDAALNAAKDPSEALAIGQAALSRDEFDFAERGLRPAAADRDSPIAGPAAFSLGTLYEKRDQTNKAVGWYEKAADAGHAGAMYRLGELAEQRDPVQAGEWYERAAGAGHTGAMCRLAELAEARDFVEPERSYLADAEHWYRRAADLGHPGAKSNLERLQASRHTVGPGSRAGGRRGEDRALRRCWEIVPAVNRFEREMDARSDAELQAMTGEFRQRYADGESLDDLLPEAFATVREAARRRIGKPHFDVQLVAGAALHWGMVAEMKDGEGKTLAATLAAYLNALTGNGVHVVTISDYLAQRDAEWMGAVYRFLGLEVDVILAQMTPEERRKSYLADITYGTNNEFGFDYLRDNMAWTLEDCVQRGHYYAIVDEVDSIFIDQARNPLIVSGPAEQSARWYTDFAKIAPRLRRDEDGESDYEVDEKKRTVGILESGVEKVEDYLGIDNLYNPVNASLARHLQQALQAKELYKRDKDYIVREGEIVLFDRLTGQTLERQRYQGGLHEAIQAKEGVQVQVTQTLASVSVQSYFRMYTKLAGMTATATTEAAELSSVYRLQVVEIPTRKPIARIDDDDVAYRTERAKFSALIEEVSKRHHTGQPILIGTLTTEKAERVSRLLADRGIEHKVLDAKHREEGARIIAQAGQAGAVTVVPSAAGRGVDITLGGNVDYLAAEAVRAKSIDPAATDPEAVHALQEARDAIAPGVMAERDEVVAAGGLAVLGTERDWSRRADNRLRGRAGRRGDPGESMFMLSFEDELLQGAQKRFNRISKLLSLQEDTPLSSRMFMRRIERVQANLRTRFLEQRKNVLKYDDVLNRQRQVIYGQRRTVLEGGDLHEQIRQMIDEVVTAYINRATSEGSPEEWDLDQLWAAFRDLYHPTLTVDDVVAEAGAQRSALSREFIAEVVDADAQAAYDRREAELTPEVMRELERRVVLAVLDHKWREHLYDMDLLYEGINWYAKTRREPFAEFQRQSFHMFNTMMEGIKEESVAYLFNSQVEVQENPLAQETNAQTPMVTLDSHEASP